MDGQGTRVLKLDSHRHGAYQFETVDARGEVVLRASGVIHDCVAPLRIIRTFEMEGTPYPAQLEYLEFEPVTPATSRLLMHVVYKSSEVRDQILRLPFAASMSLAHDRIEKLFIEKLDLR